MGMIDCILPSSEGHHEGEVTQVCDVCGNPMNVWQFVTPSNGEKFLAPCSVDCGCDERRRVEREKREQDELRVSMIARSGIPIRFQASEIDWKPGQASLYLFGKVGTGKTTAACALGMRALAKMRTVRFVQMSEISAHEFGDRDGGMSFFDDLQKCDLLIIDDLGKNQTSEWSVAKVYDLVNARYNSMKPMIITSNHSLQALARELARKAPLATAEAIARRIGEMCHPYEFGQQSMR